MSKKLRACPFCGSEDVNVQSGWSIAYVYCKNCKMEGPVVHIGQVSRWQNMTEKATALWNARAADDVMLDTADEIEASKDPCLQWLVRLLREEAGR